MLIGRIQHSISSTSSSTSRSLSMDEEEHAVSSVEGLEARPASRHGHRPPPLSKRAVWPLLALLLAVQLSWSLYQLPVNRVIERRLCREYYSTHDPTVIRPDGSVEEELCKLDEIQQHLAWVLGAMETAWIVGGKSYVVVFEDFDIVDIASIELILGRFHYDDTPRFLG